MGWEFLTATADASCVTSKGVVDDMKPFRSCSATLYGESTVFDFGAVDPMAAKLFLMVGGNYLKKLKKL